MALHRAMTVAMAEGPRSGFALIDDLVANRDLESYHLSLYAAQAEILCRLGTAAEAAKSYDRALALATNGAAARSGPRKLTRLARLTFGGGFPVRSGKMATNLCVVFLSRKMRVIAYLRASSNRRLTSCQFTRFHQAATNSLRRFWYFR